MGTPSDTSFKAKEVFAREIQIFIQAPCMEVHRYVADITRHWEWAANSLEIRHVAGPQFGVGATFRSVARRTTRVAGTFMGRIRIIEDQPPQCLVYETEDTTGRYHWSMMLTPEAGGTRLTQRMAKLSGPWYFNLLQPMLIWPLIGRPQAQGGLEKLKARLERAE